MTDALTAGTLFAGRYEISSVRTMTPALLMGEAKDRRTEQPVTIHLFCSNVSASARWRESFCEEAERLRSLPDLGQPRVLDCQVEDHVAGLVCEPMEGQPLITPGQVHTPASVVAWACDIASLLSQLHAISPPLFGRLSRFETLWAKPDQGATLLRFGVPEPPVGTSVTTGVSSFQAPEAFGNQVRTMTAPADVYWLGAVMLLALNGVAPPSSLDRASRQTPLVRAAGIPDDMWQLVNGMLTFKPPERPRMDHVYRKLLGIRC